MSPSATEESALPLVSVVLPCYNGAAYIRYAVRSALEQTYPHLEVIVVDDGSTDDSRQILESAFGDRITLVAIANSGPSAARNVGLKMARGEYVQFLDADNVLTLDKIALTIDCFLASPDADVVFTAIHEPTAYDFTDATGFSAEEFQSTVDGMLERAYELMFPGTGIPALETSQPLFRRSTLEQLGAWDESLTVLEDSELTGRLALAGIQYQSIPIVGVIYRNHPGDRVTNRMKLDNEAYFRSVLTMIQKVRQYGRLNGPVEAFALKYLVWIAGLECIRQGRREHARRYLAVACEIRPGLTGPWVFRTAVRLIGPVPALSVVGVLVNIALKVAPRRTRKALGIPSSRS